MELILELYKHVCIFTFNFCLLALNGEQVVHVSINITPVINRTVCQPARLPATNGGKSPFDPHSTAPGGQPTQGDPSAGGHLAPTGRSQQRRRVGARPARLSLTRRRVDRGRSASPPGRQSDWRRDRLARSGPGPASPCRTPAPATASPSISQNSFNPFQSATAPHSISFGLIAFCLPFVRCSLQNRVCSIVFNPLVAYYTVIIHGPLVQGRGSVLFKAG